MRMSNISPPIHDPDLLDSAWKCALDCLLGECLAICFPAIAAVLDLSRPATAVDAELHQPADGTAPGASACHADRVVRCFARDGREVCLHLEVQCQHDAHFPERMFVYHALLFAKYRLPVISLAILGDSSASWRPTEFGYRYGESVLGLRFGCAKLLDLEPALPALLEAKSQFGLFVAGHLEIMRTKGEPLARRLAKCRLAKTLLRFGLDEAATELMLELLDRLMQLPPEQDGLYRQYLSTIKEAKMQTLMQRLKHDIARRAIERGASFGLRSGFRTGRIAGHEQGLREGREEGRLEGREEGRVEGRVEGREEGQRSLLIALAEQRFGQLPAPALARLRAAGPEDIARLGKRFCDAQSLDELLG
jgi:hypothetical protein